MNQFFAQKAEINKMAWNVQTEWDDIHRKIGNYEPLPFEQSQKAITAENIQKLEDLTNKNPLEEIKSDEDLDIENPEEDKFFEEYKRKKLEAYGKISQNDAKVVLKKFSGVLEISAENYVRQVNEAGEDVPVLLNFYQDSVDISVKINHEFEHLATEFPKVKFLRTVATKCVPNFQNASLPYILYYRNGKLQQTISAKELFVYRKLSAVALEDCFWKLGIPEFAKNKKKNNSAKDFYNQKMGKKDQKKEEFSSDEEEREDKQFISNKAFIRY